jgi:hypothetical protein
MKVFKELLEKSIVARILLGIPLDFVLVEIFELLQIEISILGYSLNSLIFIAVIALIILLWNISLVIEKELLPQASFSTN